MKNLHQVFATGLVFVLFSVLYSSCALPIHSRTVANRFDSPEAQGGLAKGHLEGGVEGGQDYMITPDATTVPINLANPGFSRSDGDAFVSGGVGITDQVDVDIKIHFNSDSIIQAKVQVLGDARNVAKEGNISLAGTIGIGGSSNHDGATGFNSTASDSTSSTDYEFALIGGYRFFEHGLLYTSPYFIKRNISGTISQSNGSNTAFASNLDIWGEALGVQLEAAKACVKIEYAAAYTSAMGLKTFGGFWGASLGYFW